MRPDEEDRENMQSQAEAAKYKGMSARLAQHSDKGAGQSEQTQDADKEENKSLPKKPGGGADPRERERSYYAQYSQQHER